MTELEFTLLCRGDMGRLVAMVYVRRVLGLLPLVMATYLMSLFVVDAHGFDVFAICGISLMVLALVASAVAIWTPVEVPSNSKHPAWMVYAAVYARRLLAIWFVTIALNFALRIPGNWSRHNGHGESAATKDLIMVVLFGGLSVVVLLPTRRENRRTDVTSS